MHFQGRAESGADYAPQYELRIAYPSDNPENIDSVLRRMRKPDLALRVFTVKVMAGHLKYSAWCSHAMCIIAFVRLMYEKQTPGSQIQYAGTIRTIRLNIRKITTTQAVLGSLCNTMQPLLARVAQFISGYLAHHGDPDLPLPSSRTKTDHSTDTASSKQAQAQTAHGPI
jgi:hypothetical protein